MTRIILSSLLLIFAQFAFCCVDEGVADSQRDRVSFQVEKNTNCNFIVVRAPRSLEGHDDLDSLSAVLTIYGPRGEMIASTHIITTFDETTDQHVSGFCMGAQSAGIISLELIYQPQDGVLMCSPPALKFENIREQVNAHNK